MHVALIAACAMIGLSMIALTIWAVICLAHVKPEFPRE